VPARPWACTGAKSNHGLGHVDADVDRFRTRVRFPAPPPRSEIAWRFRPQLRAVHRRRDVLVQLRGLPSASPRTRTTLPIPGASTNLIAVFIRRFRLLPRSGRSTVVAIVVSAGDSSSAPTAFLAGSIVSVGRAILSFATSAQSASQGIDVYTFMMFPRGAWVTISSRSGRAPSCRANVMNVRRRCEHYPLHVFDRFAFG